MKNFVLKKSRHVKIDCVCLCMCACVCVLVYVCVCVCVLYCVLNNIQHKNNYLESCCN